MVKDPGTGKVYYTEKVETEKGGAVKLTDARSGSLVTIQNSELKEISKDAYKQALAVPEPAPVPAAAAPAPAFAATPAAGATPAPAAPAPAEAPAPAAPETPKP